MIKEDIPLYKLDLTGEDRFNKVNQEFMYRQDVKNNNIVIPNYAPFYQKSVRLYDKNRKPLVENEDYEFYGIMGKLTKFTGKPVGLFIRILKDEITEWYIDYQVVGNFNKITNEILNMLKSIHEDDRYVDYENIQNRPLWFIPEIHQHDLAYQIYGFTDLVRELNRIAELQATMVSAQDFMVQVLKDHLKVYVEGYKKVINDLVQSHINNKHDAHGTDKTKIGLGLVDNIPAANLQETLEGLRDDLTITPFNAKRAAMAASGTNERLYPAGALPILRYGSDTFIPPTISGSFEGLGGLNRQSGAIVETDGTLLMLQHRNNGKIRGLYFIRSINWRSQNPDYEFTSYQYVHPTATADGAQLDTIMNGSNRYIMVVGDSVKNIWYWCETKGTFNPNRHVLHRITGVWIDEDLADKRGGWIDHPTSKMCLLADSTYPNTWCIVQGYNLWQFEERRQLEHPSNWYNVRGVNLGEAGFSFIVFHNLSSKGIRANVDFTHPVFGNKNDKYFTPWWPEFGKDGDQDYEILSHYARYDPPSKSIWGHRTIFSYWKKMNNEDVWNFKLQITSGETDKPGGWNGFHAQYRARLTFDFNGDNVTVHIKPSEGSDKLYTIDPYNRKPGVKEYDDYYKWVFTGSYPDGCDLVGHAMIADNFIVFADGAANGTFPSPYFMLQCDWLKTPENILMAGGQNRYYDGDGYRTFDELNPIGLSAGFVGNYYYPMDSDDPKSGCLMTKQLIVKDGKMVPQWIARKADIYNTDYSVRKPPEISVYGGQNVEHYPYLSEVHQTNLGQQVRFNNISKPAGVNNPYNRPNIYAVSMLGASAGTYITGKGNGGRGFNGDGLLVWEMQTKLVNNVINFTPKVVFDLNTFVRNQLVQVFAPHGFNASQVTNSWTVGRFVDTRGYIREIFGVYKIEGSKCTAAFVIGMLGGYSTPTNKDGYQYYRDVIWNQASEVHTIVTDQLAAQGGDDYTFTWFNELGGSKIYQGACTSVPYKARNPGNGQVVDDSTYTINFRFDSKYNAQYGDGRVNVVLEVNAANHQIMNSMQMYGTYWNIIGSLDHSPWYGMINTDKGLNLFETAGNAGTATNQNIPVYQAIASYDFSGPMVVGATNIITPAYTVYFQKMTNILLAGKMYNIPAQYIDILDIDPDPANKTYYVYLYYSGGLAKYSVGLEVRPESASQSLIATIYCGPTQIDRIIPYNRFSLDGATFTTTRQGSSVLGSTGSVFEIGDTDAILLPGDFLPEN